MVSGKFNERLVRKFIGEIHRSKERDREQEGRTLGAFRLGRIAGNLTAALAGDGGGNAACTGRFAFALLAVFDVLAGVIVHGRGWTACSGSTLC